MAELLLLCGVVALLELDTTYIGQILISRPVIVGAVLGSLTGNFFLGLHLGIFTELIYLDFIPIGGVVPPSGAISTGTSVLMAYFFGMDIHFAFFVGIVSGIFFSFIERRIRRYRSEVLRRQESKIIDGALSPLTLIVESLILQYLCVFTFMIVILTMVGPLFTAFNQSIPEKLNIAFKFSYFIVPWVGLSILFISFSTKPKAD
jgi:mannose/fructose/N-acetylgalactosamine-specific phosphotransferase system component IIC